MKEIILNGKAVPVVRYVRSKKLEKFVPLVNLPQMSDERWNELVKEQEERRNAK